MKIKHLFFDLDNTLWDFERNNRECLSKMYAFFDLKQIISVSFDDFLSCASFINHCLWEQYYSGNLSKELIRLQKYTHILYNYNAYHSKLAEDLLNFEEENLPHETLLIPEVEEILKYLLSKKYKLYILSNGSRKMQIQKIESAKIAPYFEDIFTSEEIGFEKPDKHIFDYVLANTKAKAAECVMIGNNAFSDVLGAKNAGISQIYCNFLHKKTPVASTFEIHSLSEIKQIL